jgi:hypothetical protein
MCSENCGIAVAGAAASAAAAAAAVAIDEAQLLWNIRMQ